MSCLSWAIIAAVSLGARASAQSISPSAFIIAGNEPAPPPPPPPPPASGIASVGFDGQNSSPPPASPPAAATTATPPPASAPASNASAVTSAAPSKGSSGLSGGAIAGIVIGVLAGLAIVAVLAFFLVRRRRQRSSASSLPVMRQDVKAAKGYNNRHDEVGDEVGALPQLPASLQPGTNPFLPSMLSWKPDEGVVSSSEETSSFPTIRSSRMGDTIQDSLTDSSATQTKALGKDGKDSDTFLQVLQDNSSVIVIRRPDGSVKIRPPDSNGTTNSQASTISTRSAGLKSAASSHSVELPDLPWSDWEIKAADINITKDSHGEPVKLGSGAYGAVYKATIDGVTEVAVKMFHDVHNNMQQADILREVAILKSCRDRNIVQFLGACIMNERMLLVTELMESGDLWHALLQYKDSGVLSWYRRGKRIAVEIARGLHFLHRHNIVHFDLKSPNVLLTRDGTAKISDVGFANILSNTHLSTGEAAFTFAWAAPEVLIGAPCSNKVDMYSFGVIMWELITGEQPRRGMLREINVPEECPEEVEKLLSRCLMADPAVRPNCREIVEVLTKLEDIPAPGRQTSGGTTTQASNRQS